MKKDVTTLKNILFIFFPIVFIFFGVALRSVGAEDGTGLPKASGVIKANESNVCEAQNNTWGKFGISFPDVNILKSGVALANTLITSFVTQVVTGRDINANNACSMNILENMGFTIEGCEQRKKEKCEDLAFYGEFDTTSGVTSTGDYSKTLSAGSLLGMINVMDANIRHGDIPVNLAFFWNKQIENVPIANRALAAPTISYSGPYLEVIYYFWELTRNIAYGIVSISILITGFFIITRRKISAQASVSVQMAIPRIVLGLIYITFSYPIGAIAASLAMRMGWTMMALVQKITADIISSVFSSVGPGAGTSIPASIGAIISLVLTIVVTVWGSGFTVITIGSILMLIIGVLYLLVLFRIMMVYMNMIFSIIAAPITFAIGIIPGREAMTEDWFKKLAQNVITIAAMIFMAYLSIALLLILPISALTGTGGFGFIFGMFSGISGFVAAIVSMATALKMPGTVEKWLFPKAK